MYVILILFVLITSKKVLLARVLPLLGLLCLPAIYMDAQSQEQVQVRKHRLVDFIEVNVAIPGGEDSLYILKFLEEWGFDPIKPSISKQVLEFDGTIPIRNISYEFHLLDPHLVSSGNRAFPEPDSMDEPTRQLQEELIDLITTRANFNERYKLGDQLLSVIFHEEWSQDSGTFEVTKRVRAITPVIWQRRQTEAGDPVNEADTGLPVYYKNQLQQIHLRNP
jgi:hypothetical protein